MHYNLGQGRPRSLSRGSHYQKTVRGPH